MHRGYVQLWRKSLSSPAWQHPKLWRLWCYCLLKASHRPHQTIVGTRVVDLSAGQFVLTRRNAAQDTGLTQAEVRSLLALAERLGMIARRSDTQCTVVSVVNWARYQQSPPADRRRPARVAPADDPSTTAENQGQAQDPDFARFWEAYPRKTGQAAARRAWREAPERPPLPDLLAALAAHAASDQWRRENGRFIPNPATWLSQGRWADSLPASGRQAELLAWARGEDAP